MRFFRANRLFFGVSRRLFLKALQQNLQRQTYVLSREYFLDLAIIVRTDSMSALEHTFLETRGAKIWLCAEILKDIPELLSEDLFNLVGSPPGQNKKVEGTRLKE